MKPESKVGIVGWGVYIPRFRIKIVDIASMWGFDVAIVNGLRMFEKAVGNVDEDAITIGYEASKYALQRAQIDLSKIGAVLMGTESKPYAVKPSTTIIADALGIPPSRLTSDLEFACRAAGEGIRLSIGLISSGMAKYALVIGSDTAQASPGDVLELTASSGAAAYILGPSEESVAVFEGSVTYVSDTPDFWRRDEAPYPMHGEAFTGEPAYFHHIVSAAKLLMEELGLRPSDFDYAVFHQPNGKFPLSVGKKLGIPSEKIVPGLVTPWIGNTYNGSMLIGLAKVLENAKPGQRILAVTFGSGAGSDAFSIVVKDGIEKKTKLAPTVEYFLKNKVYIDYSEYAKMRGLIRKYKL